jgi:hypothetical protein
MLATMNPLQPLQLLNYHLSLASEDDISSKFNGRDIHHQWMEKNPLRLVMSLIRVSFQNTDPSGVSTESEPNSKLLQVLFLGKTRRMNFTHPILGTR